MSCYDYIYYPYINFRSDVWLKKMALYADSVSRIVPDKYPTRSTPTVDLLQSEKFIQDIPPYKAGPDPGRIFSEFLLENQERLKPRFAVDKEGEWRSDLDDAHVRTELDTEQAYVEASKLRGADIDAMADAGLVVRGREEDVNWIGMHPLLANTFMTLLMNGIIQGEQSLQPVADFGSNAVDVHIDSKEDLARALLPGSDKADAEQLRDAFVAFAFEQVLPADLENIDIQDVWAIREKFAGELGRFQCAVADFTKEHKHLEHIKNEDRLVNAMSRKYEQHIQPTLDDLDGAFLGIGYETVFSSMGITFSAPAVLTGLGVAFIPIIAGIAGGALAIAQILHKRNAKREDALKHCEYAWLYRIEEELTKEELSPKSMASFVKNRASALWRV